MRRLRRARQRGSREGGLYGSAGQSRCPLLLNSQSQAASIRMMPALIASAVAKAKHKAITSSSTVVTAMEGCDSDHCSIALRHSCNKRVEPIQNDAAYRCM
jgi:hypothetical protein